MQTSLHFGQITILEYLPRMKWGLGPIPIPQSSHSGIINNFDIKYKNYQTLTNINNINKSDNNIIDEINVIINEKINENKIKYINIIDEKMRVRIKNEIVLEYKINKNDETLKIFGDLFVLNKNNYKMIINDKEYELKAYLDLKNFNINNDRIVIKLKEIKTVTHLSEMFAGCNL